MKTPGKSIIMTLFCSALFGCGGGADYTDLQQFMADVNARPKQPIEPLPPFEQVPPFAYQAGNLRSPFEPPVLVKRVERDHQGPTVVPDFNRVKQFLEQYPIAQLSMVGTLSKENQMFGLVKDGDGGVHRVRTGDYMGTDYGKIQSIDEGSIELLEIVPDGTGGWVERARTVSLAGGA